MSTTLTAITADTPAPKEKRERIVLIETQPESDWLLPAKTKRRQKVWYLHFRMTGRIHFLYGPVKSKRRCLLFLDNAID